MHTDTHGDVFDQALIPMARIAVDGRILATNDAFSELLGYSKEQLQAMSVLDITVADDRQMTQRLMARLLEGEEPDRQPLVRRQRKRYQHADGGDVHVLLHSCLVSDATGQPAYFFTQVIDRSAEERALQQHRAREAQLQGILDAIPDAVIAVNVEGEVQRMNPTAEGWLGLSATAALGMHLGDVCLLRTSEGVLWPGRRLDPAVLRDNPPPLVLRLGGQAVASREVSVRATPITEGIHAKVIGVVLVLRDVGHEQRMHEQLRQAQKLEAIGQLAGGVAHDFNNLLATILGSADLLRQSVPEDSESYGFAEQIVRAGVRAGRLTQQLLTFSSRNELRHAPTDIHELLREVGSILFRSLDKEVQVEQDFGALRHRMHGDPGHLRSALLNIGLNAIDAIQAAGKVRLVTRDLELGIEECRARGLDLEPGHYLQLLVEDDGCGIPPSRQHRVFDPFFTTKVSQQGAGLGLAEAYGSIRRHAGTVRVASSSPDGTVVEVLLPVEQVQDRPTRRASAKPIRGAGRILLVDDEDAVRRVAGRALETLGYSVVSCASGTEALQCFATAPDSFSLVVLDQVMPGMRGAEVLEKLREIDASVPVVMATGYSNDELGGLPVQAILPKPYLIRDLSEVVHRHIRRVAGS